MEALGHLGHPRRVTTRSISLALALALALVACDGDPGRRGGDGGPLGDAAGALDGAIALDAEMSDGGGAPGDGGPPPCGEPPGSACNPIVIDTFPFRHEGDTAASPEDALDAYACAPTLDESGPEVHYELRLAEPTRVMLAVEEQSGVDVDVHVLRSGDPASCVSRANTTLEEPLGAGRWRVIVDTYHEGSDLAGGYALVATAAAPEARALGTMWNTYYYLSSEDDYAGAQDTPIYDGSCNEIARVRQEFHDSVCIEGSGILGDGRVINYASTCTTSCPSALTCGARSYRVCYSVVDGARYPWGVGAASRALEPDRSMAVDPAFVALGSWVYFEELDGLVPPGETTPHDGCLRADDTGGAIDGNHFDFFSGTRARWLAWETQLPTRSDLTAWLDHPRCYPTP